MTETGVYYDAHSDKKISFKPKICHTSGDSHPFQNGNRYCRADAGSLGYQGQGETTRPSWMPKRVLPL